MTASEWVQNGVFGDTFQMTPKSNDNIGCASVKNYELYNRKHIVYWTFGFEYFDEGNFSADDRLIYGAYMKEVDSLNPA